MRPRNSALLGSVAVGAGAAASIALGPVTNYASETVPGWARDPGVVWGVFAALGLLSVGLALLSRRLDQEAGAAGTVGAAGATGAAGGPALHSVRVTSLRPPHVEHARVRGRTAEIERLSALLARPPDGFAVVCGAGGFGKTTLAAALAEQAERDGYTVFWIRWQDRDSFVLQMTQTAIACGLTEAELRDARTELVPLPDVVWRRLSTVRKWLLVVDNADQPEQLGADQGAIADYRGWVRPGGGGLLLLTSRDTSRETWGPRASIVELATLDDRSGAQVLCDAAPQAGSPEDAEKVSQRLGGLPLALRSAGAYLSRPGSRHRTFNDYRGALDHELPTLMGATGPVRGSLDARQVVRHTWELSLDQLESAGNPVARPLLRMLALAADAPIPREWVTVGMLKSVTGLPLRGRDVESALSGLHQYGLISFSDGTRRARAGSVQLHALVREINAFLLDSTPGVDATLWRRVALARTTELAERVTADSADWVLARTLAPHVEALFRPGAPAPANRLDNVRSRTLKALFAAGEFALAASLARAAYEADVAAYGADHIRADKRRHALASALSNLGLNSEAAALLRQTLAHRCRALGETHYFTLQTKISLGMALSHLGQHEEALALLRGTVEERVRILGEYHRLTLVSRSNLANALSGAGRYEEAARIHRETLEVRLAALGPDDVVVLQSKNNLAGALDGMRRHDEAAALFRETLRQRESALGPDHPRTLDTRQNLARALFHLGERTEPAALLRRTLEGRERSFGPDHTATSETRELLATVESRPALRNRRRAFRTNR
ncbi:MULTISPECIES: tetratricopeptide repeat protein [unclassified Streptomyces]|uniref:tetratricopeptide repeat protein n=1 Tax=unclassified Streptomyces TaxID=2593676 RepID=UPI00278C56AD|nr:MULTISPECIES: tetratricopeptide repeat protein [unclassified Streptomyces]